MCAERNKFATKMCKKTTTSVAAYSSSSNSTYSNANSCHLHYDNLYLYNDTKTKI